MVYSGGQLAVYGGTSAGTPAFAGVTALLNHYLVSTGAQNAAGVGNMNPRLYALAQAGTGVFHDVTTGDNIVNVTCGVRSRNCVAGTYGYAAGQGYDQASGLGSVDAYNLVTGWLGAGSSTRVSATVALQTSANLDRIHGFGYRHRNGNQSERRHPHRRPSRSPPAASRSASHRSAARVHPPPPASRSAPRDWRLAPTTSWPSMAAILP